jgi:anaerobic sulfite reductase subunit C
MKWTHEAEEAIKKVPFFMRKRVRTRVEEEAKEAGQKMVSLAEVRAAQARFLTSMKSEIKGYQLETCFGPSGCPNRAAVSNSLLERIELLLKNEDLLGFLSQKVKGGLKFHHEFKISLADCPNACSQPQIKDIGIIGACTPRLTDETCTQCEACVAACQEDAIRLDPEKACPAFDYSRCLSCGRCAKVCPTGAIAEGKKGFRVQLGGKLGRHPQLARELSGIYSEDQVLAIIKDCLRIYKARNKQGERFGQILKPPDFNVLANRIENE